MGSSGNRNGNGNGNDEVQDSPFEYVGFWPRVGASLIDTVLVLALTAPLLSAFGSSYLDIISLGDLSAVSYAAASGGWADFLISYVLPPVAIIVFWLTKQATPGKMAIGARVVDARNGATLTPGQSIGRYLGYYVALLPFFLGFLWIAFDPRKQGWHDKLAGTVVIRRKRRGTEPVHFEGSAGP